ncbi:uncharacterized protein FMAN_03585 [Fusarium mangiferae]|uniref:GATA-type domain-containing protein n=1 Tax=Fusarium mangiferae TaxID=192010 RepID=A0A1L7TEE7_FUSMA|nr:uncharacterized protein FMAN_03585 [Fusarium mangiferae]CVK94513.1 uncharacterized protein FMAN_03585 [Fusarium mangiferae]
MGQVPLPTLPDSVTTILHQDCAPTQDTEPQRSGLMMSNGLQMLEQVTRGRSLQPSRANAPTVSPNVAIEQPKLPSPGELLLDKWESGYRSALNSTKTTKTKVDDKSSVSRAGFNWDKFTDFTDVKVDDMNLNWDEIIPADRLAEMEAEEQQKKEEAYIKRVVAENAPRKAAIKRRNRKKVLDSLPEKPDVEQQDRDIYSHDLLRAPSLEGAQGYHPPEAYGPLPLHRNTDRLLDCRLQSNHYTISQDHTSGQEAHEESLLASFGNRRRTDKPSMSRVGRGILHRSPNSLPSLENSNDVATRGGGSGMQKASQDDLDFLINWRPVDSKTTIVIKSFPKVTATTDPNEEKDTGDEVKFEWVRKKERRHPVQSLPGNFGHGSQHFFRVDTSRVSKSGDRPLATLTPRCHSCNRSVSSEWRRGPDGAGTLCSACGLHYAKLERKRKSG